MRRALVIAGDARRGREVALAMRDRGFAPALARTASGGVAEARIRHPDVIIIDPDAREPSGARTAAVMAAAIPGAQVFVLASNPLDPAAIHALPVPAPPAPRIQHPERAHPVAPRPRISGGKTTIGELVIHDASGAARLGDDPIPLTPREATLLRVLADRYGEPVTRDEIGVAIWGCPPAPGSRAVDVLVRRLRRKVDEGPGRFTYVQTVLGVGYRLQATPRGLPAS